MPESLRLLTPIALVFVALISAMWWGFDLFLDLRGSPNRGIATGPGVAERVVLEAGPGGHYFVAGEINGQPVRFLVDTGAGHVAVPGGLADRLGLSRGAPVRVRTAAGTVTAYQTRIDRIAVGGIVVENIRGSVNPAMDGDFVLLGMTFLRHVDISQRGGRLVLEPPRQ